MAARTPGVTAPAARAQVEPTLDARIPDMRQRRALGIFRVLIAAIEVVALIGNYEYVLGFRFFATANFFSYFTIQSAMLAVATLGIAAAYALLAPSDPPWLGVLRTMVTAYLLVSGIVFALIVSQASTRDYRVDVPPTGKVTIGIECGPGCRGDLPIDTQLKQAPGGEWRQLKMPLHCFQSKGADLRNVTAPFLLTTAGKLELGIANVRLESGLNDTPSCD